MLIFLLKLDPRDFSSETTVKHIFSGDFEMKWKNLNPFWFKILTTFRRPLNVIFQSLIVCFFLFCFGQELMEKHRALSQEHYSKMDALEEAYQVNLNC